MESSPQTITLVGESSVICRNTDASNESSPQAITLVGDQGAVCSDTDMPTLKLTPTGKISHAKTRVYTQRYRKEWEQMSDFKGWLTSVPLQPTRAYCLYCKQNLHAHRLSLLKHTCTMKHQRSSLTYVLEEKQAKLEKLEKSEKSEAPEVGLVEEVKTLYDSSQTELGEENEDDIEYVVERLEDEDESIEFKEEKERIEDSMEEEEIEVEKEIDTSQSNEDSPTRKKIKLSPEQKCRDPLAEAMAHVHSEYLEEEVEYQGNVQMEMVVESTNDAISVLSEPVDDEKTSKCEDEKTVIKTTKNGKVLQEDSKNNLVVTSSIPILNTAYQTNVLTSTAPIQNTINFLPIAPNINQKTITLMCGNKSFTLTGGTFQPGMQYVLTKLKGKPTALMLPDQKKVIGNEPDKIKVEPIPVSGINQTSTVPSTSQQPTVVNRQGLILSNSVNRQSPGPKSSKKPGIKQTTSKKLRISTYVVDTIKGIPISGLQVSLYKLMDGKWTFLNESTTNAEGYCTDLVEKVNGTIGRYKIHFDVDKYFTLKRIDTMFPFVEIVFDVKNPNTHYHIPLLLSPFGYTTYRGT